MQIDQQVHMNGAGPGLAWAPEAANHRLPEDHHQCLALDVVSVLLTRSTMDEVAQYVVLQALADFHPWQASIYEVGPDSLLRLAGSFGLVDWRGDLHEHSCLDDPALGESLRGGVLQPSPAPPPGSTDPNGEHQSEEPVDGHQVIWPLITPMRLSGVLQVRFHEEPPVRDVAERLAELSPPIALALDLAGQQASRRRFGGVTSGPRGNSDGELTPRQREVLRHMSTGMTNGQIARILKFSESTVRQETMAIYRTLQVRGRAEAVQYAEEHGLLERAQAV